MMVGFGVVVVLWSWYGVVWWWWWWGGELSPPKVHIGQLVLAKCIYMVIEYKSVKEVVTLIVDHIFL